MHEGLITSRSRFFRNALNGSWQESDTKIIPLDDVLPSIFEIYLNSLYFNRLPVIAAEGADEKTGQVQSLIEVYILADRLMDSTTKNLVIEATIGRIRERKLPKEDAVSRLYDGTTENDPMRKLFVNMYVKFGNEKSITDSQHLPEFMHDVLVGFMKTRSHIAPSTADLENIDPAEYRCKEEDDKREVASSEVTNFEPKAS